MPAAFEVQADSGILLVRDPSSPLPAPAHRDGEIQSALVAEARAGHLFHVVTDDPLRCRLEVYAGETLPSDRQREFERVGGSFLLHVPSGRLSVSGYDRLRSEVAGSHAPIDVPAGRYLLAFFERRAFDAERHEANMLSLLGRSDWEYSKRIDRLGLIGCLVAALPVVAGFGTIFVPRWRPLLIYVLPLILLAWAPYHVLRLTTRYRAIQRRAQEHEDRQPHYIVVLEKDDGTSALEGGFVRV